MQHANPQADLFPAPQRDLFDGYRSSIPEEEHIKALAQTKLAGLLAEVRGAERLPWDKRTAEVNAIRFHNMANWLPPEEREVQRAAFRAELARLRFVFAYP